MTATLKWRQQPWAHGINFYGVRVKPADPPFKELGTIIKNAADRIATSHKTTGQAIFADSGLDFAGRLHSFIGTLLVQLGTSTTPHALDFSGITDGKSLADLLGFVVPHVTILAVAESARSTHDGLMSLQWGNSDAWLDANFANLNYYLAQLVRGTFIDRNGTKLAFGLNLDQMAENLPQIATNLAPETPQIAGELIYALVEYLGDQEFQVPCYDPSAGHDHYKSYTCYKAGVIEEVLKPDPIWTYTDATGLAHEEHEVAGALIAFSSKIFEASVKSFTGTLVRGVTVVGLNNEAIAEIIATALGVAAKKLMEAFTQEVLVDFIADQNIDAAFKDEFFTTVKSVFDIS